MIDGVWDGIGVLEGREVEERGGGEGRERERWMDEWMEYISMDEIPTLPYHTQPIYPTLPYLPYLPQF